MVEVSRPRSIPILVFAAALACESEPQVTAEPCEPSIFEAAQGFDDLGTDCGAVHHTSTVSERQAVRDCMIAAVTSQEPAYAWADNGVDSTSRWIIYIRPTQDPPIWGVSYTSDPTYGGPGNPLDEVAAYSCVGIAETAICDESSPAFCIDCVGLAQQSEWSCKEP